MASLLERGVTIQSDADASRASLESATPPSATRRSQATSSASRRATGSEFSVIRADNATGNFTKVAQRLTVRVAPNPDQPIAARLASGMSVIARLDTAAPGGPGTCHRQLIGYFTAPEVSPSMNCRWKTR